eukprot:TRINITY_DN20469_c0_g1_i1.p2 TRINITY_DN20469_c0_g1~~TRINITY_DN20469_c0_g1_i1.p2  ORF type:complete len:224 (-),score=-14.96 TRINITY_DN20469_c0_g1_i1:366-1037(-)
MNNIFFTENYSKNFCIRQFNSIQFKVTVLQSHKTKWQQPRLIQLYRDIIRTLFPFPQNLQNTTQTPELITAVKPVTVIKVLQCKESLFHKLHNFSGEVTNNKVGFLSQQTLLQQVYINQENCVFIIDYQQKACCNPPESVPIMDIYKNVYQQNQIMHSSTRTKVKLAKQQRGQLHMHDQHGQGSNTNTHKYISIYVRLIKYVQQNECLKDSKPKQDCLHNNKI